MRERERTVTVISWEFRTVILYSMNVLDRSTILSARRSWPFHDCSWAFMSVFDSFISVFDRFMTFFYVYKVFLSFIFIIQYGRMF